MKTNIVEQTKICTQESQRLQLEMATDCVGVYQSLVSGYRSTPQTQWWTTLSVEIKKGIDAKLEEIAVTNNTTDKVEALAIQVRNLNADTLTDQTLVNVDPWNEESLTPELKAAIIEECKINPLYFFKLCLKPKITPAKWSPRTP